MNKHDTQDSAIGYPAGFAWLGLAAVYAGFLSVGIIFHFLPPILSVVITNLDISHTQAGLLMSLFALPGILLSLPGGWLVDRYGERLIGGGGLILMGAGTVLLGLAPSFSLILAARAVSGIGAMVGVVALQRLVIRLFTGRGLGLPVGISGSAVPVGIIIILNTSGRLAATAGWREVAVRAGAVTVAIGLVFTVVIWFVTRGRPLGRAGKDDMVPLTDSRRTFRPIWIAGVVWFCANGAMTAFMTFAPDHFQGLGFNVSSRGLFTSIPMWTSAALGMITGWLTDRHGGRALFMTVGMALMGTALVLLPSAVVSPSLIGLALGLSLAAVVTPTISLPGALLPDSHTGRGYGILATCANLGIFVVPPLAGWSRDLSGGYVWPFVIMGLAAFVGMFAAAILGRGRFMPGFSRRAIVPAALLMLLLIGCGSQDRYELVEPQLPVVDEIQMGEITDRSAFLSASGYLRLTGDAWSVGDFVASGRSGRLVRVQGDLVSAMHFPSDEGVVGMLCRPDGSLLVGTPREGIWRWTNGDWQLDPMPPDSPVGLMSEDHLGQVLVAIWNQEGATYSRRDGVWQPVDDGSFGHVVRVWSLPGQGTWLLTDTDNILQLAGSGVVWEDSLSFADQVGTPMLAGDSDGHLACANYRGEVWLRENGSWIHPAQFTRRSISGLFWAGGVLHAINTSSELVVWRDGAWEPELSGELLGEVDRVVPVDGGHLLISVREGVFFHNGQDLTQVAVVPYLLQGLAEYEGRLMACAGQGELFRAEDVAAGVWRYLGRTEGERPFGVDNMLVIDDRGRLLAATVLGLEEWDDTQFNLVLPMGYMSALTRMPDGEILVIKPSGEFASLRDGQVTRWTAVEAQVDGFRGIWRRSERVFDLVNRLAMYRFEEGAPARLLWSAAGWTPDDLVVLKSGRAVVLDSHNTHLLSGDQVRDITPRLGRGEDSERVTLMAVHELDDGALLGWAREPNQFMLMDEAGWHALTPAAGSAAWLRDPWEGVSFLETRQQGLYFFSTSFLAHLGTAGGQW